jgi:hypothetical protein
MELPSTGDRVKVETGGPELDGIVFDVPTNSKVVVAVMDRERGPVLRTVRLSALTERTEDGPDDARLQLLVRRTPPTRRGAAHAGSAGGPGRAGHRRAAGHRTTGK